MATKHLTSGRWHWGPSFAGYKVYVYEPGTSTAKSTYSDSALTTENTHPVTLDANGAGQIWFAGNAKIVVYTASGSVYQTDDNVNRSENSTATGNYNLIINGSFEDDAVGDGVPDGWDLTLYTDGAFVVDTATQFHGQKSAKFTSTGTGGGYLTSTSMFAVRAGRGYNVLFGISSSVADVRNVVQVLWYKADGTASATASSTAYDDSATNPTSWTAKTAAVTAPADAYFAKLRLIGCHNSDATSGVTWFDDVTITDAVTIAETQTITGDKTFSGTTTLGTAVVSSAGVHTAGTVPLARIIRTEVYEKSAAPVTVIGSLTELVALDLGTVVAGDIIDVTAVAILTKGATGGKTTAEVTKKSGTATVVVCEDLAYLYGHSIQEEASAVRAYPVSGKMRVTVGGTLVLKLWAESDGSDSTSTAGNSQIHAIVLNNG